MTHELIGAAILLVGTIIGYAMGTPKDKEK